ncbi:BTAD domain-containing putative transcriptional regulator [Nocardia iowensis]|uniref:AAA family ATPase n=1 Tax=Nocardia iowensis TaxID=204891 RepID=A0ABX8RQG2_NOCIO|nr:BTAD domain-containing putative transcriptional regulator [Nocardia iowensis]QXN91526.1 AAA family ATPase [Nocardia iowensis]
MDQADAGAFSPAVLRFTLLNGVEAHRAEQILPLGPPQRRAVLCVLAFRRRQWVSASSLLAALYDGVPPASGVGVIQTYVSALRRVLEPDRKPRTPPAILLSGHGGYQLRIDDEQTDLGVFDRLVGDAARAREAGDLVRAEDDYAHALALYAGEPLAGLPGPFAQRQRAALAERRLTVLEDSLDVAVVLGRSDTVIDRLRVLTAEHPLRERPRAVLMRALYSRGRQSEALDVYRETRKLLIDQLGVEPGEELRSLHNQILSGESVAQPVSGAGPTGGSAVRAIDIAAVELRDLAADRKTATNPADRVAQRTAQAVEASSSVWRPKDAAAPELSGGAAGHRSTLETLPLPQGAEHRLAMVSALWPEPVEVPDSASPLVFERDQELTRIAAWTARAVAGNGGLVVISGRPGFGKTQLLDEVARRVPGARRVDLLPPWDGAPPLGLISELTDSAISVRDTDARIVEALCAKLIEDSADRPLVVLVDGAEQMDERSARVLTAAAPRLRRMRVLVVVALDERSWEPAILDLHARLEPIAVAVLRPSGLSVAAIEGLYERRTGTVCPPGLAADIQRATADIPLLAGALITDLAALRDHGHIPDYLPEGCYSRSISRLLGRYSPGGVGMLRALAVLQDVAPTVEVLAAGCAEPVSVIRHRCEVLTASGILASVSPPVFRHPLIGNTLRWLGRNDDTDRIRIAAAEQARSAGYSARQVAAYLADLVGEQYAGWTVVLLDAAEECLRNGMIGDAVQHLAAALRIAAPEGRDDILVRLGQLELWTNPAAARAHLDEALRGQRDRRVAPTALIPLAWTMSTRSQAGAAMALLDEVLAETEQRDALAARDIRSASWAVAGLTSATWNDFVAALRADGRTDQITTAILTWDDAFRVRRTARATLARFPAEPDPDRGWDVLPQPLVGLLAQLSMWSGDLALARQLSEQRKDHHFGTIDVYRLILRSEVLLRCGDYRRVLREVAPTVGTLDDESIRPPLALVAQYAHALLELGRLAEAEQWLASVTEHANPETWEWTVVIHVKGMLCAARGDSRQAVAHYLDCGRRIAAVGIRNPAHIPWRSSAAMELVHLGERERARELAAAELELAHQWDTPGTIGRALRATASAAPGGVDAELLEQAVGLLRRCDSPVELIPALLELAAVRHDSGDTDAAGDLRWEARSHAENIGATRYLEHIGGLLGAAANIPSSGGVPTG